MLALISVSFFNACDVVDLQESGNDVEIADPVGFPESDAALLESLAGSESRQWNALTFSLEGLRGVQSCRLDDDFTFFAEGTYRYDGGTVLCGGQDDTRIKTGTWRADFSNRRLIFDEGTSLEASASISGIENNRIKLLGEVLIMGNRFDIQGIYEFSAE